MFNLNAGMFGGDGFLDLGRGRGLQFVRPMNLLRPPQNVTAIVSGSNIDITWTAANNVDGYNIYQSIDDGAWVKLNATATTDLTYTLTPTESGEYNFRVTSVRGTKESAPSAETLCDGMMEQVYSDTITGLRISAVDGTAFVDGADEEVYASDFSSGLDGWAIDNYPGGAVASLSHNVDEMVLAVTSAGTNSLRPYLRKILIPDVDTDYYTIEMGYTVNSGTCQLRHSLHFGIQTTEELNLSGSGTYTRTIKADPTGSVPTRVNIYFNGTNTFNLSIHSITVTKHPAMSISADYADGNHLLEIEDSLGNVASGVLSAQGSGEVLGTEQVSTWTNFMSSYETFSSSGQNIASAINTDSSGVAYAAVSVSTGELVKYIGDITINSGYFSTGLLLRLQRGAGTSALFTRAAGSHSLYLTSVVDATSLEFTTTTGVDFSASNNSLKQVTAPSTSGAFIVSEIDGATQNFVSIPAGFTYNESSYICRVKKILPTA